MADEQQLTNEQLRELLMHANSETARVRWALELFVWRDAFGAPHPKATRGTSGECTVDAAGQHVQHNEHCATVAEAVSIVVEGTTDFLRGRRISAMDYPEKAQP